MPLSPLLVHNFEAVRARELGKIEALIPNLRPNAPVRKCCLMLHENLSAEHHLTGSLIRTNHWKILKNPQNGFFKGIFSSVQTDGAQMKLTKRKFGQRKFENKQHEVIGTAKLAHRKSRWKLWKIIAHNSSIELDQRGQRGKYLLLEELKSPWDLSITSHESDRQ